MTTIPVPGYATVRTNPFTGRPEALGVVGDLYTPMQNEDHAAFLNTLADESGAIFDTAGSLNGGRQVFITMRLPDTMKIGGTDRVDVNIAALTPTTAPAPSGSWSPRSGSCAPTPKPPRFATMCPASPSGTPATPRPPSNRPATRSV